MRAGEKKTDASITTTTTRLKREQCKRTKHDSVFSEWKILVGPCDWEDYLKCKEGAERYRTQNLPNSTSCPGVYELGVITWRSKSRKSSRKIDPNFIIPVYLGQADNVRNRLQQYGREGSHLQKVHSNSEHNENKHDFAKKAPGLFTDVFSRGFSVVYRWAPIDNKREAQKTELLLLNKFDYAWNKESNGSRRHDDILKKLDRYAKTSQLKLILKKFQVFPQKKMGIKIKVSERHPSENGSITLDKLENGDLFCRILKFGRSQPRPVSRVIDDYDGICGVALGHGYVCKIPPIEGRKRCAEHKGMKINGFSSEFSTNRKSLIHDSIYSELESTNGSDPASICGYVMDSGCLCINAPVKGNKRCLEHKGRRNCNAISNKVDLQNSVDIICGLVLENGLSCTRSPVLGRKRCEEHKGMRVKMK